mmetsp:Transcript_6204/g.13383  ORF Transcript_6204/g.13383 Transcript_6204/m.13383 type:complete len:102 (+) Transcript_6204:2665-2970(+)
MFLAALLEMIKSFSVMRSAYQLSEVVYFYKNLVIAYPISTMLSIITCSQVIAYCNAYTTRTFLPAHGTYEKHSSSIFKVSSPHSYFPLLHDRIRGVSSVSL